MLTGVHTGLLRSADLERSHIEVQTVESRDVRNGKDTLPATYSIDVERKLVISVAWGVMTSADVREHRRALRNDPLFDRNYRELVDMTGITEDRVDLGAKQEISQDQLFAPGVRRAWVASADYAYGMARMYAIAAEKQGQDVGVFRTRMEAEEWLDL
jgi:hypothetical protein